jgi:hypothetical protein
MSGLRHNLVGYDRRNERVAEEFDVPETVLPRAKEIAAVPADDPDAIMCYPLDGPRARDMANLIEARIDTDQRDYFLEGAASGAVSYEFADDAEFRPDSVKWSIWIHNYAKKDHIKVSVARATLDDYASNHGHKDHRMIIGLLNGNIGHHVQETINRALDDGRATAGSLELNEHDLAVMLDK